MLKEHFRDLFTEGLGDIFYMKYYNFINKNIKNDVLREVLIIIHTLLYIFFILGVAYLIFKLSFPL